jgi:hypothetical protein
LEKSSELWKETPTKSAPMTIIQLCQFPLITRLECILKNSAGSTFSGSFGDIHLLLFPLINLLNSNSGIINLLKIIKTELSKISTLIDQQNDSTILPLLNFLTQHIQELNPNSLLTKFKIDNQQVGDNFFDRPIFSVYSILFVVYFQTRNQLIPNYEIFHPEQILSKEKTNSSLSSKLVVLEIKLSFLNFRFQRFVTIIHDFYVLCTIIIY